MSEPTDEQIVEVLATRGMGWYSRGSYWFNSRGESQSRSWNPLTDRNALAEVEARLTETQRQQYLNDLVHGDHDEIVWWYLRHAPPNACARTLARVLAPELFVE